MKNKLSFLLVLFVLNSGFAYSQYTFYDCSNDTIVLGQNTEYNIYDTSTWGGEPTLFQYDTIYFESDESIHLFISDSLEDAITDNYGQVYNDGIIIIDYPAQYAFHLYVDNSLPIAYIINVQNIGGESSIIRAFHQNDGGVALRSDTVFKSYLWSTEDTTYNTLAYQDSAYVYLQTETFCDNYYYDSIFIAPQNAERNFIIGEINDNIRIIDQDYPLEIRTVENETTEYPLDINDDGVDDINFWTIEEYIGQMYTLNIIYQIKNINNTQIFEFSNVAGQLDSMEIISEQYGLSSSSDLMYYYEYNPYRVLFPADTIKYIGFKLTENNKDYLGWIKIKGVEPFNHGIYINCHYFDILEIAIQNESYSPNGILNIKDIGFSVYPNPTNDIVNIEFDSQQSGIIKLVDLSGRVYFTKNIDTQKSTINMETLDKGVYFIIITDKEFSHTEKIIKSH